MWDLCRTRSDMVWLSLTAGASGSDPAQSMLQQHQSHLPRCLQACLAEQPWLFSSETTCIEAIWQRALQQPDSL